MRLPGSGSQTQLRPSRPGLLRVCVHIPPAAAADDISALRVLLVADLLARAAELTGWQVLTALEPSGPEPSRGAPAGWADALGIHPPTERMSFHDAPPRLAGLADVHLVVGDASLTGHGEPVVAIAAARLAAAGTRAAVAAEGLPASQGHSPLAVRLALMSFPSGQPAELTEDGLTSADGTLAGWRRRVAGWAESPSRPIPASIMASAAAAFADLDAVSVLGLLRGVDSDASVAAGAKFETFVYADRFLGLDLAHDVGQSADPGPPGR